MKFKKSNDTDNMMVRFEMRNVFHHGRSMPLYWEYEQIESFTCTYHFGFKPFNRKRDTYSYYKDMFRSDYNDGIFWNGEEP
jgi:hypothetical protein